MWSYEPPLRAMRFVIDEVLDAPADWPRLPAHADFDADTAAAVIAEAGKFVSEVIAPINGAADLEGCKWTPDGKVTTPAGYRDAWRAYVDAGWPALACDADLGGQGLPLLLNAVLNEMLAAGNHGWTMYPGLLHGAYECIKAHASPALRERWLPGIVSGETLATMCLTEPQAGSDLGQVRTRAEPQADGSLRISGNKIFISGGEHDLTDNIVHLVLCRLPDAPAGSKGLSLALVPKLLDDGSRNALRCDGIEKKMGIKGSATCVMAFEGATGWLIGEPGRGLNAMFVMMNSARLHVAMQGLGHLEAATQNALRYVHERTQGKARPAPANGLAASMTVAPQRGGAAGDPIALHAPVRRILSRLQALAEGQRVLAYATAQWLDRAEQHPDAAEREKALGHVELMTPLLKAMLTENGFLGASDALQLWGGYGYVHEYGIEQTLRDSRIAMIYEGTNEIQALDLVQRKLLGDEGRRLGALLDEFAAEAAACRAASEACDRDALGTPVLREFATALEDAIVAFRAGAEELAQVARDDPGWPAAVAGDVLKAFGLVALAWGWARSARAAARHPGDAWYAQRIVIAGHGRDWLLPELRLRLELVRPCGRELPWLVKA
ncbi:acyl-CoA dehydrogenase family protein [Derxia gummosa]|uniref:3-methylmercaptopropionyl-CoA dehydrogenase n=1 Tax=Derxia gummosa DSM 723 TaxID=1121388 RepID=A0A8B6X3R3_9BURK|nr:acyl-CoA dehydrogenase family protein [Derxia gummosa]